MGGRMHLDVFLASSVAPSAPYTTVAIDPSGYVNVHEKCCAAINGPAWRGHRANHLSGCADQPAREIDEVTSLTK